MPFQKSLLFMMVTLTMFGCSSSFGREPLAADSSAEGMSILHYDASQRGMVVSHPLDRPIFDANGNMLNEKGYKAPFVISEPPPDIAYQEVMKLAVSLASKPEAQGSAEYQKLVTELGVRSQSVQILRDALFRLTEISINRPDMRTQDLTSMYLAVVDRSTTIARAEIAAQRSRQGVMIGDAVSGLYTIIKDLLTRIKEKKVEMASFKAENSRAMAIDDDIKNLEAQVKSLTERIGDLQRALAGILSGELEPRDDGEAYSIVNFDDLENEFFVVGPKARKIVSVYFGNRPAQVKTNVSNLAVIGIAGLRGIQSAEIHFEDGTKSSERVVFGRLFGVASYSNNELIVTGKNLESVEAELVDIDGNQQTISVNSSTEEKLVYTLKTQLSRGKYSVKLKSKDGLGPKFPTIVIPLVVP